jgi:hypothetical protein
MDNEELRDRSRQLAREVLDVILSADLNVPLPDEATNNYESLACQVCKANLLETRWGNFVWAENLDRPAIPRFVDAYWVCKGGCDKLLQAALRVLKYSFPWADINDLINPLDHKRWDKGTSRLINRGVISETAAVKVEEFKSIVAPLAARKSTEEDIARFRHLRLLDGLY